MSARPSSKPTRAPILVLVSILALTAGGVSIRARGAVHVDPGPHVRNFDFTYGAIVRDIPEGAKTVAVWLPYAVSDAHQEITDVRIQSPYPTLLGRDPEYGNTILYVLVDEPKERSFRVEMNFHVERREFVRLRDGAPQGDPGGPAEERQLERWLRPDRFVPLDDRVRALAAEVTRGRTGDLDKARAIYDHVVSTMTYDKSGTGWGRGDITYACNVRKGNCTDFHALFIGLCRASGIPAKFAIGFPLPEARGGGEIGGYHCWAEFYVKGIGWIPVDASEASKHPSMKEYFFGAHDENRVQFTIGRDMTLVPPQRGDPVNFFIYPYVEVDGRPFQAVDKKFTYTDRPAG